MNFNASKFEIELIVKICERAEKMGIGGNKRMNLLMDIEATHSNGNQLMLNELLESPDGDFTHDIMGIRNNINRTTGKLENCFSPRCSVREVK